MKNDLRVRFEAKISREENGCWLWVGAKSGRSYRYMHGSIALPNTRKSANASRVSWELYRGAIPAGICVLHKCDNPLCVNPDHLFLGTHAENMADMKEKGRSTAGERSTRAKLTSEMVAEIRSSSHPNKIIANRFGVAPSTVSHIRRGRGWSHISGGAVYRRMGRTQTAETREKISAAHRARAITGGTK